MKILAITQARVGSSRLPAKVLKQINNKSLLELHLERVRAASAISGLVVATTLEDDASKIVEIAEKLNIPYFRGSTDDVLDRFYQAASCFEPDYIVRVTSDCPLIDPLLIDKVIRFALDAAVDYVSNTLSPTFPDGQDVEVIRFSALEAAWKEAKLESEREHVTSYIWKNSSFFGKERFKSLNYSNEVDFSNVRLTVDEERDFQVVSHIVEKLGMTADWETYTRYYNENIREMSNISISRNEGYYKSLSNDAKL